MSFQPAFESTPKPAFRHGGLGILTPGMDSMDITDTLEKESRFSAPSSYADFSLDDISFEEAATRLTVSKSMPERVGLGLNMTLIVGSISNGLAEEHNVTSYATESDNAMPMLGIPERPPSAVLSVDITASSVPSPYTSYSSLALHAPINPREYGAPQFKLPPPSTGSVSTKMASVSVNEDLFDGVFMVKSSRFSTVALISTSKSLTSATLDQAVSEMTPAEQDNFIRQLEERTSCGDLSSMSAGGGSLAGAPVTLGFGSPVLTEPSAVSIVSSSPVADEVSEGDSAARSESPIEDAFDFGAQDGPLRLRPEFESGVGVGLPSALGSVAGCEQSNTAAVNFVPVFVIGDDEDEDGKDEDSPVQYAVGAAREPEPEFYFYGPCPSLPGAGIVFTRTSRPPPRPLTPIPDDSMSFSVSTCLVSRSEPLPSSGGPIAEGPRDCDAEQLREIGIPRPAPVKFWSFGYLFRGASAQHGMVKRGGNRNRNVDDDKTPTQATVSRLAKLWSGVRAGFQNLKISPKSPSAVVRQGSENFNIRPRALRNLF